MAKRQLTDEEVLAQIPAATARAKAARVAGHRALTARYDRAARRIILELSNGYVFGFPITSVPALEGMTAAQLARVTTTPSGSGISWEAEDIDLSVPGLLLAAVGTEEGMRMLGAKGGQTKSAAKANAARANGAKGGRPRKRKVA